MPEKISARGLNVAVHGSPVLRDISLSVMANEILAIIGPAHSGKTTFLRCINRLIENQPGFVRTGELLLDNRDVRQWDIDTLRRRVGMIFATPIPLPGTIFDNVAYGPRLKGVRNMRRLAEIVEKSLRAAFLWDEVKDRLFSSALRLSGGQQQRLCIARTLAVEPEVVMMDEPCSGLDPISTAQIEQAMRELKQSYTFILVTNNVKQAARVSDRTAFFLSGELVELGPTAQIFTAPRDKRTDDYVSGRIG
ncbi:MAG: phosphate ABC transporter ATP-binding protein [candidate division WOR-3 bacterium]|uniref:Phosphate ABC transporter ATP-binding protein n=1 Tax=candidate division WOR-3 bacterium TaxID=2052148 RepID=A0A7C1N946_UNCW3|nr:phosphate ABC transporter ATP-binding protein [candidate division WOR-3 bacterium]